MADELPLQDPWLIAAWPGMGSVALAAASHLVAKLGAREVDVVAPGEHFDVTGVTIEGGVARRAAPPKSALFAAPAAGRAGPDLLLYVGEAQPSSRGYEFCHRLLDRALARGARRIVTFAAMATPLHPAADPRVFGVASSAALLPVLARNEVAVLAEGQISGLNGVLVAAAAERGLEAFCLLGELPFFAVGIPNPKASLAVLRAFGRISGLEVDLAELEAQAQLVERGLVEFLEREARVEGREPAEAGEEPSEPEPEGPSKAVLARIEDLFRRARADKSQALRLKSELDELGLFRRYEDRFLDLFKREEHG